MKTAGEICLDMFNRHFWTSTVAPGDPYLNYREVGCWFAEPKRGEVPLQVIVVCMCLHSIPPCLHAQFPVLALTTVGQNNASRMKYEKIRDTLATATSGEYSHRCIVPLERTLDEAYFQGLSTDELALRNADQVISSKFRGIQGWSEDDVPIVMVPQLWLWRFGNLAVPAHSMTHKSDFFSKSKYHGEFSVVFKQPFIDVQLGLVMADCIEVFGIETVNHNGHRIPPTLDLFESRVVSILSDVDMYIKETKRNAIDYYSEANFLHVLSDCRSELVMIQAILEQEEIIVSLLDDLNRFTSEQSKVGIEDSEKPLNGLENDANFDQGPMASSTSSKPSNTSHKATFFDEQLKKTIVPDWSRIEKAHTMLKQYQKRIKKIDGDAERIEKNVQDLLKLKRTYASVQNSHAGVLLSVTAIGFAIVTVIFAPLAFLVGLFALELPRI
jgi:hypothetical protein